MEVKKMSGKRNLHMAFVMGCVLAAVMMFLSPVSVKAAEPGTWLVTVKPSYTDPETGKIEDPGNNEAIGQGMTEKLCGPTGLLEVDASGNTWLTVRYYLSQFVKEVTFEERRNGAYSTRTFQEAQIKPPVEGAADIDAKYGYTDYRISINSMDSVFRGKAYIEPMGRSVVYFFTVSNPLPGSGDFITAQNGQAAQAGQPGKAGQAAQTGQAGQTGQTGQGGQAAQTGQTAQTTQAAQPGQTAQAAQPDGIGAAHEGSAAGAGLMGEESQARQYESEGEKGETDWAGNNEDPRGGGAVGDPVTGIPRKPGSGVAAADSGPAQAAATGEDSGGDYHLQTPYNLSDVPLGQARKLTKPILESAAGITGVTGTISSKSSKPTSVDTGANGNKMIMMALLAIAAILLACFGIGAVRQKGRKRPGQEHGTQEHDVQEHRTQEQNTQEQNTQEHNTQEQNTQEHDAQEGGDKSEYED